MAAISLASEKKDTKCPIDDTAITIVLVVHLKDKDTKLWKGWKYENKHDTEKMKSSVFFQRMSVFYLLDWDAVHLKPFQNLF